jgi:membrane-associated phospholipid phosphatase
MNETAIQILASGEFPLLAGVYQWGIDLIKIIQRIESPLLTGIMKAVTAMGTEYLYVPLLFVIFWCVDEKKGLRLGLILLVSVWANLSLKAFFGQPRPYTLDPSVGRAFEPSYGLPSGHAQMSVSFWVPLAVWGVKAGAKRGPLIIGGAACIILLIAFTRLYLGVHFPTDILAGWLCGGVIVGAYFLLEKRAVSFLAAAGTRPGKRVSALCVAAAALAMNAVYPADKSLSALLLGFGLGYVMMSASFPFAARGRIRGKKPRYPALALRCILGFAGTGLIYAGLTLILPGKTSLFAGSPYWGAASPYYELGRFIRYGVLGLWVAAGAPKVFLWAGLASAEPGDDTA